jgi:hypothetical protein
MGRSTVIERVCADTPAIHYSSRGEARRGRSIPPSHVAVLIPPATWVTDQEALGGAEVVTAARKVLLEARR